MRRANPESWRMSLDFPEELQFGAYIGQREGFLIGDEFPPRSPAEAGWRVWWESLPTRTFGSRIDQAIRKTPDALPREFLQRVDPREQSGYDPPNFMGLRGMPALQKLCQLHWRAFNAEWGSVGGRKMLMVGKMNAHLQKVRINKLVEECVRGAHKSVSRPFHLRVDFVIWPEEYWRDISNHHLVLGVRYLEPTQANALRAILKTFIVKLV